MALFIPSNSCARCLIFGRTLRLLPYSMCANSEGSGEIRTIIPWAGSFHYHSWSNYIQIKIFTNFCFLILQLLRHLQHKLFQNINKPQSAISDILKNLHLWYQWWIHEWIIFFQNQFLGVTAQENVSSLNFHRKAEICLYTCNDYQSFPIFYNLRFYLCKEMFLWCKLIFHVYYFHPSQY